MSLKLMCGIFKEFFRIIIYDMNYFFQGDMDDFYVKLNVGR